MTFLFYNVRKTQSEPHIEYFFESLSELLHKQLKPPKGVYSCRIL